ncbi:MAG: zinc-binding dehydrogenase [Chloroflexi bacterium]|nr:zinc-binding dehydrogenase [Chloroflexota bacterium]MYK36090.1 zinc-binding dehydrogenase [Chloroflexota bacterium]
MICSRVHQCSAMPRNHGCSRMGKLFAYVQSSSMKSSTCMAPLLYADIVHPPPSPVRVSRMRAVLLETAGPALHLRDAVLPDPQPAPDEALLRVTSCGFSHHDALIMEGALRRGVTLPRVLGHEVAGVVCGVGDGVPTRLIGTEAVVMPGDIGHRRDGGFAEMLSAPVASLVPLPQGMAATGGALLASPIGVALRALEACGVAGGETLVVTGASGGVGAHAAQAAHAMGASVIGITGSPEKAQRLEGEPWLDAVLLDDEPWEEVVAALTGDMGADAALDTTGTSLGRLVAAMRQGGRIALVGQTSPDAAPFAPAEAIFRELTLVGSLGVERRHVERALSLVAGGQVTPLVHEELPLSVESVTCAYRAVKRREVLGRVVLRP